KQGIAVAGTHGKTTTTSLIASVLAEGGLDPTFVIGGRLLSADANARLGGGEFLVAEADESDASFLYLSPVIAVVTNIDADHLETYDQDFGKLKRAFVDFLQRLPFYGVAVLCFDDPNLRELAPAVAKPVVSYGVGEGTMLRAVDITSHDGRTRFAAQGVSGSRLAVELALPGLHNVRNALAAIAVGREVGVADAAIARALAEFKGVGRRFQRYGNVACTGGHFALVDDYGHHPAEMAATIAAVRDTFPGRRVVLAFQPHRYTRTRDLFEDFVRALSSVDALVLTDVYPAGEAPIVAADGRALARAVRVAGRAGLRRQLRRGGADAVRHAARRRRRGHDGRGFDRHGGCAARRWRMRMNEPLAFAGTRGVFAGFPGAAAGLRGALSSNAPLARHTSWRAGEKAETLYVPADRDDLAAFLRALPAEAPVTVIGLGSNVLIRDGGIRGAVVLLHDPGAALTIADGLVYAEAGLAAPKLARFAATRGCTG